MSPTGLDQSWSRADPRTAKNAGVQVISGYLSWSNSKDWSATWIKRYHAVGIGDLINWESQAGAPLKGAGQGRADATRAVQLLKALIAAVGYRPRNRLIIYFSCDTDVNSSQYGAIDAYYRAAKAVCAAAGFGIGVYGEADLVHHLHAAGITDAEWQTLAWSRGIVSPDADFYQSSINNYLGGASVDFDRVIHPSELGAWWAPGSVHDVSSTKPAPKPTPPKPAPKPTPKEDPMAVIIHVSQTDSNRLKKVWPGYFILSGREYTHIATKAELTAYYNAGYPVKIVSYADHLAYVAGSK